ncbi:MAG: hypothetical protein DWQ07_19125 [Chloroflexi bacterium]|nr:MAG: hypothetical protein DWQ07_19125 [Chloroflexota bacterium]MBL1195046.1 hypothetical protein [Chloroflexota bacterium]NOH12334.1 hypothetical protein [Chloroflexota bacterium]
MHCSNCSSEISQGSKYCTHCGHNFANEVAEDVSKVEATPAETAETKARRKRRRLPGWIWIFLGILIPAGLTGLLFAENVLYIPQLASVPVTTPVATFEGARLLVMVSDADGKPVANAKVQLYFGNIDQEADTDVQGEARFPDLPQNSYTMTVSHPDHETWQGTMKMTQARVNTSVQLRPSSGTEPQNEDLPAVAQGATEEGPGQAPGAQCDTGEVMFDEDFEDGIADDWREGRGLASGWVIENYEAGGKLLHVSASPSDPSRFALLPNVFKLHFAVYIEEGSFHLAIEDHFFTSESMGLRPDKRWHILSVEMSFNGGDFMILVDGETVIQDRLETTGFKKWVALEGGPGSDVYFDNFVACER